MCYIKQHHYSNFKDTIDLWSQADPKKFPYGATMLKKIVGGDM